ncbi:hypothetical protein [Streptomyces sp. NPDC007856]|uniref:hypothetical protein n=1 Tax=Streptomyces sp. NPDC007856 TaxID=3364781 RepID=UPI00368B153B
MTIRDVASATVFDEDSRHVILHAGSRACHSVPLLYERGALLGVISSSTSRRRTTPGSPPCRRTGTTRSPARSTRGTASTATAGPRPC